MIHSARSRPARFILLAAGVFLLAAGGLAIWKRDAVLAHFESLHEGREVTAVGPDLAHHHAGHNHGSATRTLGSKAIGDARLTAIQIGKLRPDSTGTFQLQVDNSDSLRTVAVWIGEATDSPARPYHTPDLAMKSIGPDTHFHLPALAIPLARQALWLEVHTSPLESTRLSFPLTD